MAVTCRCVVLKLLSLLSAVALMALCGYDFYLLASAEYEVPMDIILPVYYGLFGFLLLVAEFDSKVMKDNWSFLYMRVPKAIFLVL